MFVLGRARPNGDVVGGVDAHGHLATGDGALAVITRKIPCRLAQLLVVTHVVQEEIDRRARQTSRPFAVRRVETDVNRVKVERHVPDQKLANGSIQVGEHSGVRQTSRSGLIRGVTVGYLGSNMPRIRPSRTKVSNARGDSSTRV